jgi:hypothetical protein
VADGICNNCGAGLAGPYCHRCGQKEADTDWRSIGALALVFDAPISMAAVVLSVKLS